MTTPELLATLDAEETRLLTQLAEVRTTLATLRRLTGTPAPPHGPTGLPAAPAETPPGKAEARPAMPGGPVPTRRSGRPPASESLARPLAIARAMLAGPRTSSELLAATGMPVSTFCREVKRPECRGWWQKQGGQQSPWELTPEGRAAVEAAG